MDNLVFNRIVSLSRATHTSDGTAGSQMLDVAYATDIPATIQPKRDRNLTPQNYMSGVNTESADAMTTWKIVLMDTSLSILKNDTVTDEAGVAYRVELPYKNPYGWLIEARILTP